MVHVNDVDGEQQKTAKQQRQQNKDGKTREDGKATKDVSRVSIGQRFQGSDRRESLPLGRPRTFPDTLRGEG